MGNRWFDIYLFSILLGITSLVKKPLKISKEIIKRIIVPMDLCRYFEIPQTITELDPTQKDNILDLSSPKLAALYISKTFKSTVIATDLSEKELDAWKKLKNRNVEGFKSLEFETVDGRRLPYKNNTFSKVYSISVIEHIPKDGDTDTIIELARVLKPGGILVVTLPYRQEYREYWSTKNLYGDVKQHYDNPIFNFRIYNNKSLTERISKPSGLKESKRIISTEKYPIFSYLYSITKPFSIVFGLFLPLFALITLRTNINAGYTNTVMLKFKKD